MPTQPKDSSRFYPLIQEEAPPSPEKQKTYWDHYPELKQLRRMARRSIISFLFFSVMFLFSTLEYIGIFRFGPYRCCLIQIISTLYIIPSTFVFDYGLQQVNVAHIVPFMAMVMLLLSCYLCLFGLTIFYLVKIPPHYYFQLSFHLFFFIVASLVAYVLLRATDMLWQGFFTLVEISSDCKLIEKLRNNQVIPNDEEKQKNKEKGKNEKNNSNPRVVLIMRGRTGGR